MPIDPQARRLMAMLEAGGRGGAPPATAAERRSGFAGLMRMAGRPPEVGSVEDAEVAGGAGPRPARVYGPPGRAGAASPGLVYFHGGGLVAGGLDTHDALCRTLAAGSGCRVVSVDYRLAPEHPFPAAVDDAVAALGDVLGRAAAFGLDPRRVAVGGDSGGGTLAAVAALGRGVGPALQFLLCPVLDLAPVRDPSAATPSRALYARGHLLDAELMARDLADYAPDAADLRDPRLSPLHAPDLTGAPPAVIHTAEFDPLRDEGALYAARLADAGVAVEHRCHPGMIHHFYGLTGFIPAAAAALAGIAEGLGRALGAPPQSR